MAQNFSWPHGLHGAHLAPPPLLHFKVPGDGAIQFGANGELVLADMNGGPLYPPLAGGPPARMPVPYLGGLVTLVGKDDAHYEGTLMGVNPVTTEISVANGVFRHCNSGC